MVEELPRRVDSHDSTRQNLGVIEERFERRLGGRKFFVNMATGATQWDDPREPPAAAPAGAEARPSSAGAGAAGGSPSAEGGSVADDPAAVRPTGLAELVSAAGEGRGGESADEWALRHMQPRGEWR